MAVGRRWATASPLHTESTSRALATIQERSRPNPERPRLRNDALEAELEKVDRCSASCYADVEMKTHQLHKLARLIDAMDDGGIPDPVVDDDSLVIHIEELRNKASLEDGD